MHLTQILARARAIVVEENDDAGDATVQTAKTQSYLGIRQRPVPSLQSAEPLSMRLSGTTPLAL